ncbi:MAG: hypothetical protein ACE5H1_00810 [Thermodesulfobacteriota bacterium]
MSILLVLGVWCSVLAFIIYMSIKDELKGNVSYKESTITNKGGNMTVTDFRVLLAEFEGLNKQVNIAQISEILYLVNVATGKKLYKLIKGVSRKQARLRLREVRG